MKCTKQEFSYLCGLFQGDGHLQESSRNRGRLAIEISFRDKDIVQKLKKLIPEGHIHERTRDTNFKKKYHSINFNIGMKAIRDIFKENGVPVGKKSTTILPNTSLEQVDYIRGLIDADGSVGITGKGLPFISLNTSSDPIKDYFIDFILQTTGGKRKVCHRNGRDNTYNIVVLGPKASALADVLYYNGCLALNRKKEKARQIQSPAARRKKAPKPGKVFIEINSPVVHQKQWTKEEDEYIVTHKTADSVKTLGRSSSSIYMRTKRLHGVMDRRD